MKNLLIKFIDFYQTKIRIFKKPSCVFYPSCSQYAKEALLKYGVCKGLCLAGWRVLRCHPWQKNHMDPLP